MIVWPLAGAFDRKPIIGAVVVVIIYAVGMLSSRFVPNYFYIWTGCEYVPFFWIGFMIRKRPQALLRFKWYVWVIGCIILFISWEIIGSGGLHSLLEIAVHIFESVAAFESLSVLSNRINWNKDWFKKLSNMTMPVYLFHQQIIYFVIYWFNGLINPFLNAVINLAVALMGSIIISTVLMRWKVTRFLIGEK